MTILITILFWRRGKDLSGGKERSYVPLRFSTVKSEEETAAEEAKEDVPAEPVRPEEPAVDPVVSGQEEKPAVEEVKEAVSPAAEGKEETPAPEPKEEEKKNQPKLNRLTMNLSMKKMKNRSTM